MQGLRKRTGVASKSLSLGQGTVANEKSIYENVNQNVSKGPYRPSRIAGVLLAVGVGAGVLVPNMTANAATVTVQSLTSEIVTLAQREQSPTIQAIAGNVIRQVQSLTTTDLEQIMFNTTTLTSSQQKTEKALLSDVQTMLNLSTAGSATEVQSLVQNSVSALTGLDSTQITSNDALNYFNRLVQNGVSELTSLAIPSRPLSKQDIISALGDAVFQSGLSNAVILSLIPGNSPSASTTGQSVGQTASGQSTGTGTGGQSTGTGTVGQSTTGSTTGASTGTAMSSSALREIQQAFSRALTAVSVGATGGTVEVSNQGSTIQLKVPVGAFSQPNKVTLGAVASGTNFSKVLPSAYRTALTLSVGFSNPPQHAATLTVTDRTIQSGMAVYQVMSTGLKILTASVSSGKVILSVPGNANLVLVSPQPMPSMKTNERALMFDGKLESVVPAFVKNQTTYMPIWYVMHLLNGLGFTSRWSGQKWQMSTNGSSTPNVKTLSPNPKETGIYLNGKLVQNAPTVAATDPSTGHATTYMPIWYVMRLLNEVNIPSQWNGKAWYLAANYTPPAQ
ncbi:hypothetical protein [Alicyclobacillus mengziensis]|uniref:Uncharacterized protein n=1 Tax=Alicyclobacillus mengziensis TaxID=2931921 RepID=A0A9X7VYJ7_9BACL|nr:hypothetical protein [Alicyclobacillus mengziensis]QSO47443.1 hypothetical protein JZ786_24180 [Alicyclobacillus mengziensis]